jgi:Ca2+-binding EF-hand superfamily protein
VRAACLRQAFNRLDADGNGSHSRQEYDGSPLADRANFATADADGNGVVSFEEARAILRRR